MRERENPLEEAREKRERQEWETSERELEDTEMTRREFYMPHGPIPGAAPQRSDADIARDIESILFRDEAIRSYEVKPQVSNGHVTLSGTVDDDSARRLVESRVRGVPGVKGITNNLQVRG